jgi:phosphohistidine phosphatase
MNEKTIMQLFFLRHGLAQDHAPGLADFDRELVPAGLEQVKRLTKKLAEWEVQPSVVYTSPRLRARQTAQIVTDYYGFHLQVTERLDFEFNAQALQGLVDQHQVGESLMVVGHEPSLSETIGYIIGGGNITLKKGGLARVDLFSQHPLHGTLVWLIPPKVA